MKKNRLRLFWLRFWHLRGFSIWSSWSGFGVTTNWPNKDWEKEVEKINLLFRRYLPNDWVTDGPCFAAGGAMVMYAWPKDDPYVKQRFANQDAPKLTPYR